MNDEASAVRSPYLFWLPCRGSMAGGLIFVPDSYGSRVSRACLEQMDAGTPFPYAPDDAVVASGAAELGALAMGLTSVAWLVLVLGKRWRRPTTVVALLPALLGIGLALSSARAALTGASEAAYPSLPWWFLLEAAGVAVVLALRMWQPELRGWELARLVLVLWGVTAFGLLHEIVDYNVLITINSYNWDCPPGCGYPTAVAIAVAAGLASHAATRSPRDAAAD